MKRVELFEAKNPADLFDLLVVYLERKPTRVGLRHWTNTVLGPWHIPPEVFDRCAFEAGA